LARDDVGNGPSGFREDALAGLAAFPKTLPSKYLYDEEGSRLFEAICDLPEYYPTRMETALLRDLAPELARLIPSGATLVEFGSGASVKTRLLLDATPHLAGYTPIDISADALDAAAAMIRAAYPRLDVTPVLGDFTAAIDLPTRAERRVLVGFFPGSTIGNFAPAEATTFLADVRAMLGSGALFVVGFDLVKDEAILTAAYDDAAGVTAAFDLNLLVRINEELGGDFTPDRFRHRARWNVAESRMEMHLESLDDQVVNIAGRRVVLTVGETIHTENSYKFTVDGFRRLAEQAGWSVVQSWTSPQPSVALALLKNGQ